MPNREKAIEGLEWILQDDRFGFGVNWDTDCEPKTEEEQAGYNIQMAISLLKEQEETIRNLEQEIRDKNERLKERAEQVDSMLKEQQERIETLESLRRIEHEGW